MMSNIPRSQLSSLVHRLSERRRGLQIVTGPRHCGKTALALQAIHALSHTATYASADDPAPNDTTWLEQQWNQARVRSRQGGRWLLVLDEIQEVTGWAATVKRLWDEDSASGLDLRVLLLSSSRSGLAAGADPEITGAFELTPLWHWSYSEMRDAFGWTLDRYVYFGGYPGAADLVDEEDRWHRFVLDTLLETALARDVLLAARVDKPSLLRSLLRLGCEHSGQILSFQKMTAQLSGAGNTTTLSWYLELLGGAGLLRNIQKFSARERQRGSIPKLQVLNNGLATAMAGSSFARTRRNPDRWGRLVTSAIGAHLAGAVMTGQIDDVYYWRERNRDVDFVLRLGDRTVAVEVKAGDRKLCQSGLAAFDRTFQPVRSLVVGAGGAPVEEFLLVAPRQLFS
jgi:uncharacterized protein